MLRLADMRYTQQTRYSLRVEVLQKKGTEGKWLEKAVGENVAIYHYSISSQTQRRNGNSPAFRPSPQRNCEHLHFLLKSVKGTSELGEILMCERVK